MLSQFLPQLSNMLQHLHSTSHTVIALCIRLVNFHLDQTGFQPHLCLVLTHSSEVVDAVTTSLCFLEERWGSGTSGTLLTQLMW